MPSRVTAVIGGWPDKRLSVCPLQFFSEPASASDHVEKETTDGTILLESLAPPGRRTASLPT
jgi:hypothetical protein